MKLAIMASGAGSNAMAIIDKAKKGLLHAEIMLVLSNRAEAPVLDKARNAGVAVSLIERKKFDSRAAYDHALIDRLKESGCDTIALAGYMLMLGREFLEAFPNRVINIHPSLLPAFPGTEGAASALAYGVKIGGPSVHFVSEEMDMGPLVIQAALPVKSEETLQEYRTRIHAMEHRIYPQALQWLSEDRLSINGRIVSLKPGSRKQIKPDGEWFVWPPLEEGF